MKRGISAVIILLWFGRAQAEKPKDFVELNTAMPDASYDIRYFGSQNFVGEPIDGYLAPKCLLQREAAESLIRVAKQVAKQGLRLKIFDCYRPQRAVSHFMRWAQDLSDKRTKAEYYPNLAKETLVGDYIAERSGHSRGATVDLTLEFQQTNGHWQELDMGSAFDLFDTLSNTDDPRISELQRQNRQLLKSMMEAGSFENYSMEWWHYSYQPQPYPDTYFNFAIE
ncbi:peptidase M15 [Alteromonas aestuariivivens]|uniref:D-alanyl-D-alanine dipeptidase n=1 Tax=Alteromonas aestuariivivens TaxID=1938339 RepID=A0A3D8M997_9ALTE|nr:M15 family metallopeptidase [Alteromonas aestuariivivens]RDV26597.1 peptidase M15 [Alteromonas aestuariivivens]